MVSMELQALVEGTEHYWFELGIDAYIYTASLTG